MQIILGFWIYRSRLKWWDYTFSANLTAKEDTPFTCSQTFIWWSLTNCSFRDYENHSRFWKIIVEGCSRDKERHDRLKKETQCFSYPCFVRFKISNAPLNRHWQTDSWLSVFSTRLDMGSREWVWPVSTKRKHYEPWLWFVGWNLWLIVRTQRPEASLGENLAFQMKKWLTKVLYIWK